MQTRSSPLIKGDCLPDSYHAVLVPCFTSLACLGGLISSFLLYKRKLVSVSFFSRFKPFNIWLFPFNLNSMEVKFVWLG